MIPTPSQLVGVVGPNGCGKSNIIDAVRWVLGESRASELRGESMQDVIFNGSGNRKPSARASVELVFDNSEGRASGQWGAFNEISVGRVLSRDGTSTYLINNQQVRRRDIHDIFLGTGLGSRGYAIIGQGMINRLIEAKPEELRVYLEEAAGVSRYKERRRETESRLADTRENLLRLDDILRELETQLERLTQQAEVAAHYKGLQQEGELKQHLLWWLRESNAKEDQQKKSLAIQQAQTQVEAAVGGVRGLEARIERLRQAHFDASDAVHQAQSELLEAGAKVSSLEAEIKHALDARARMQSRQQQLAAQQNEWAEQEQYCEDELSALIVQLEDAAAAIVEAEARSEQVQDSLPELEEQVRRLGLQRDEVRQQVAKLEQALALRAQAIADLHRQREQLALRQQRLEQEKAELKVVDNSDIERLEGEQQQLQQQLGGAQQQLQRLESELPELESQRAEAQANVQQRLAAHAKLEARLAALEQLQADVQRHDKLEPWLAKHQYSDVRKLWQQIQISPGWETAVEAALRDYLGGIPLAQLDSLSAVLQDPPPTRLCFIEPPETFQTTSVTPEHSLARKLSLSNPGLQQLVTQWLANAVICDSVEMALRQREQLEAGQRFVTPQGHLVDQWSVQFYAPDDAQAGVLARQQDILNTQKEIKASQLSVHEVEGKAQRCHQQWSQLSQALPSARQRVAELTSRLHTVQMDCASLQQQSHQAQERAHRVQAELDDMADTYEELAAKQDEAEHDQSELSEQLFEAQDKQEQAERVSEATNASVAEARHQARDRERDLQQVQHAERLLQARHEELARTRRLAQEQLQRAQAELSSLQGELSEMDASPTQEGLQQALEARAEQEERLSAARRGMDFAATELREAETEKSQIEQGVDPLRAQVTELQLQEQAARLAVEQYSQLLDERKVDRAAFATTISEKPEQWQSWVGYSQRLSEFLVKSIIWGRLT